MKYVILALAVSIFLVSPVQAEQRYNPHEDRWETVPKNWDMRYNPHEDEWSYQPKNVPIIYNPHEDVWEYDYSKKAPRRRR